MDGEDQTVAGEPTGHQGPLRVLTGMEVDTLDEQKGLKTSPAQKRFPQTSMVTPRISRHIAINEAHLEYNNSNLVWECLTAACKAFSLANGKGMGTNDWVIRSLDD